MAVDPITLEIVRGAIHSTILEMEALVERTAMSPVIKEKKDFFVGVYDVEGRIVDALLSNSGPRIIDPVVAEYPVEEMEPGDLYWFNDPHKSNGAIQHTGDMCFISPIFSQGSVSGFAVAFGHFWDIGGSVSGSLSPHASEIFHEGTLVPPIKIIHAGETNREAYAVILNNSRFPEMLEGDTRALMASCRLAEGRVAELMERFPRETVLLAFDEIIERSTEAYSRRAREVIKEGEYHFFDYVDADPVTDVPRRVDLKITRRGDTIVADLSGSGPQAVGPVNFLTSPGAFSLLMARYLASLDVDLPLNEGAVGIFDEVKTKPGTITYPNFPSPVGLRSHTLIRLMGCITGAMAKATDGNAPAGSPVYVIYNLRTVDGDGRYLYFSEGIGSGQGARPIADGLNAIYFRDQKNYPIEFEEGEFPLQIEQYRILPDTGGPGRYRGGCGVVKDVRILVDCTLSTRMDNVRFPCFGINGGEAGLPGRFILNPGSADERDIPPAGESISVKAGDMLRVETCGGGGWGDPFLRDAREVRRDIIEGFITVESAARDYGVAVNGAEHEVDDSATGELRGRTPKARPYVHRGANGDMWLEKLGISPDEH